MVYIIRKVLWHLSLFILSCCQLSYYRSSSSRRICKLVVRIWPGCQRIHKAHGCSHVTPKNQSAVGIWKAMFTQDGLQKIGCNEHATSRRRDCGISGKTVSPDCKINSNWLLCYTFRIQKEFKIQLSFYFRRHCLQSFERL